MMLFKEQYSFLLFKNSLYLNFAKSLQLDLEAFGLKYIYL